MISYDHCNSLVFNVFLGVDAAVVATGGGGGGQTQGAIPKSISFDKTADRGDKESYVDDENKNKRTNFFRNFKLPFKRSGNDPHLITTTTSN